MTPLTRWHLRSGWWTSPGLAAVAASAAPSAPIPEPTAQTTGPAAGVTLALHAGDLVATADVSGLHITGDLHLAAPGITATDCRVDGIVQFSANTNEGYAVPPIGGQVLRRVWATNVFCTGTTGFEMHGCRVGPSKDTLMQFTAYQPQDGSAYLNAENITVKGSYFYPPIASTGLRHLQAVHLMGTHHVLFEDCAFDYVPPDQATRAQTTASFFVQTYPKECQDVTLRRCAFYGGGYYQIAIDSTPDVTVEDCRFHSFTSTGGGTGATQYPPKPDAPAITASGNTLDGQPYTWIQPSGA